MGKWIFVDHLELQLNERRIPRKFVYDTLNNPDEVVVGKKGRLVYHKIIQSKLMRVIVKESIVFTAYHTSKIKKYWKG